LENGGRRTFTDAACSIGSDGCLDYRLIAIYPRRGLFVVGARWGNHDSALLLVSARTGTALMIDDLPHFSPSGRRLATVAAYEGYNPDGIEIFSLESGEPKSEWRYVVPGGVRRLYRFVAWDGDERLKMTLTIETRDKGEVEAVRTAKGWSLRPDGLDDAAISRFYEKPFPVQTLFDDFDRLGRISYDLLEGFLAGVFTKDPNTARQVLAGGKPTLATTVISALQIAGMEAEAKQAADRWGVRYPVRYPVGKIVPLAALRPGNGFEDRPTRTLWAATYATGDPTYMRRIYDAYLAMADHVKEVPAIMLAECALLLGSREWDERIVEDGPLPCHYTRAYSPAARLRELDANAREHRFLGEALLSYVREQPETKGAKALLEYARRRPAR
jgi:hypothetical protein